MTAEPMTLSYPPARAPSADGQTLQLPPPSQFNRVWESNLAAWASHSFELSGRSIATVRSIAQADLLEKSVKHSSRYRDVSSFNDSTKFIIAGHQPELFHPGVWYKNFVLSDLAQVLNATPINLVIDNDLYTTSDIVVPSGDPTHPSLVRVPYDRLERYVPFENSGLNNTNLWSTFAERVQKTIQDLVAEPLIGELWPQVMQASGAGLTPTYALAAGRHRLEAENGLRTLEVPLGAICNSYAFALFVAELIERNESFFDIYNECLSQFRIENRIRSQSHPVPSLSQDNERREMPFWVWTADDPTRRRVFVERSADGFLLFDGDNLRIELKRESIADQLVELSDQGIAIRPRALITTMYSRLVLGQLFLHGIGGAKYDQLTDTIIQRFFEAQVTEFITLSATHYLPVGLPDVNVQDLTRLKNKRRELVYHPEWFADTTDQQILKEVAAKKSLIDRPPEPNSKKNWHLEMEAVNQRLRQHTTSCQRAVDAEETHLTQQLEIKSVLGSREFSFCLFPHELIDKVAQASSL